MHYLVENFVFLEIYFQKFFFFFTPSSYIDFFHSPISHIKISRRFFSLCWRSSAQKSVTRENERERKREMQKYAAAKKWTKFMLTMWVRKWENMCGNRLIFVVIKIKSSSSLSSIAINCMMQCIIIRDGIWGVCGYKCYFFDFYDTRKISRLMSTTKKNKNCLIRVEKKK